MKSGPATFLVSLIVTLELFVLAKLILPGSDIWQMIAQASGILGLFLLSWTYILAVRHPFVERAFGGLDQVYRWHHTTGGVAFLFVMQHPVSLMIRALPHSSFALYFLPGTILSYTIGIAAFYALLFLIIATLFIDLPYKLWKQTHEWMGIVIILGALHSLLVPSDISRFAPLRIEMGVLSAIAILSFVYKRYGYYWLDRGVRCKILDVQWENDIVFLTLIADEGEKPLPLYKPGQFSFLSFDTKKDRRDEHPFSVVSQEGNLISFGLKVTGGFTVKIAQSEIGTAIRLRGPYGSFGLQKHTVAHMVWVAGGIGITPFLYLLKAIDPLQSLTFIVTIRGSLPRILLTRIEYFLGHFPKLKIVHHDSTKAGRLTGEKILSYTPLSSDTHVWLCGPKPLMESLAEQLPVYGVKRHRIYFEDFTLK